MVGGRVRADGEKVEGLHGTKGTAGGKVVSKYTARASEPAQTSVWPVLRPLAPRWPHRCFATVADIIVVAVGEVSTPPGYYMREVALAFSGGRIERFLIEVGTSSIATHHAHGAGDHTEPRTVFAANDAVSILHFMLDGKVICAAVEHEVCEVSRWLFLPFYAVGAEIPWRVQPLHVVLNERLPGCIAEAYAASGRKVLSADAYPVAENGPDVDAARSISLVDIAAHRHEVQNRLASLDSGQSRRSRRTRRST